MANTVNYTIELTPANATKIDQINRILIGEDYVKDVMKADKKAATETKAPTKPKAEPKVEPKSEGPSYDEVKKAAQAAKKEHGEDFVLDAVEQAGGKRNSTLGRSVSALDESTYEEFIKLCQAGPTESASDEPDLEDEDDLLDDDDLGDDEPYEADVDPEAVKKAVRAVAKDADRGRDEAKAILKKFGCNTISDVDSADNKSLAGILKACN